MSKIDELLNTPLRNIEGFTMESVDDIDMSDIEADLADIDVDDAVGDDDLDDVELDDLADLGDPSPETLDKDEEDYADDIMAIAATPVILKEEITSESAYAEAINDVYDMISEGFLFESDAAEIFEEDFDTFEEAPFASKTKVQFSEKDRRKQLYEVGIQTSARAHNDPVYYKLQKVYKLERVYKKYLRKKYHNEAIKRVKAYIQRLKTSKSGVLNKIASKFKR